MATVKQRSRPSPNGKTGGGEGAPTREKADTVATAARRARGPLLAAGAAAAGLAGGLAAGSRSKGHFSLRPQRRLLGIPIGRKSGALRAAEALRDGAKHLSAATGQLSGASGDIREIRAQLEQVNRRSPLEVVLDGLTHRRGAHRHERS